MKLITKITILIVFFVITLIAINFIFDKPSNNLDEPLRNKTTINLFDNLSSYDISTYNALFTKEIISTGMYTDANYNNYWIILKVPPEDLNLQSAWLNGQAYIAFESFLEGTSEWVSNNKYEICMYYLSDEDSLPIYFYKNIWVGNNKRVSSIVPIPKASKSKTIYIKYSSILGSVLFVTNGNDVRFKNNYLTIQ